MEANIAHDMRKTMTLIDDAVEILHEVLLTTLILCDNLLASQIRAKKPHNKRIATRSL